MNHLFAQTFLSLKFLIQISFYVLKCPEYSLVPATGIAVRKEYDSLLTKNVGPTFLSS